MTDNSSNFIHLLPSDLEETVQRTIIDWETNNKVKKLWQRDTSLWTGSDEDKWMGWLDVLESRDSLHNTLKELSIQVKDRGMTHVVVMGMGGSSLSSYVFQKTFNRINGYPELLVLDSTDPAQVKNIENSINFETTVFIVSSKSGTTMEPNLFMEYFLDKTRKLLGTKPAGARFVAITDPGSKLHRFAENNGFWKVFFGEPSIGGRYSVFSSFGMVPAAMMGMDCGKFLGFGHEMSILCRQDSTVKDNPGVMLGIIIGVLANNGLDKITFINSPGITAIGAWLEQLLAESTGKESKGLIPVDSEPVGTPGSYANDRVFVYNRLATDNNEFLDNKVDILIKAGYPVIKIRIPSVYHVSQEFFRWEIATAVAGSVLGINPFNQPDVESSKIATREIFENYDRTGSLNMDDPVLEDMGLKLYADKKTAQYLSTATKGINTLHSYIRAHLDRLEKNDYFAILAFVEMNNDTNNILQETRVWVRDKKRVATCVGYGPRYLHSTGQLFKGGPNTGVFILLTNGDKDPVLLPDNNYGFSAVKTAQALGDLTVLLKKNRRIIRIHMGNNIQSDLATLKTVIEHPL